MVIRVHRGGKAGAPSFFSGTSEIFRNVVAHRNLTKHMISKDLKLAYHGTFLGYAWTLLEPIFLTLIFYVLFHILRGGADELLALKVMLGILFYTCFSRTVSSCTNSLVANTSLINQVYFPREIFHVSIIGYQLLRLLMSLFVIIPMMVWWQIAPTPYLMLLLLASLGVSMLALGLGFIASVIQVRVRDLSQFVSIILRAGFFLSGVFYGAEHVPEEWLDLHLLNPVATNIELARSAVLGEMGVLTLKHISVSLVSSFVVLLLGMSIFKKYEARVVKFL